MYYLRNYVNPLKQYGKRGEGDRKLSIRGIFKDTKQRKKIENVRNVIFTVFF